MQRAVEGREREGEREKEKEERKKIKIFLPGCDLTFISFYFLNYD